MVASEQSDGGSRKTRGILGCGSNISCCLTPAQRVRRACPCASAGIATINEQGLRRFLSMLEACCVAVDVIAFFELGFTCLEQRLCSLSI